MSGPGDSASKPSILQEPTPFPEAEGHDDDSIKVDLSRSFLPGSESSARSHRAPARKPGDLGSASPSMVGGRQLQEGEEPQAVAKSSEKSDEDVVPKKPAKTRVTPVESVEGRSEAKGISAVEPTCPTPSGNSALDFLQRIGQRVKATPEERLNNLLSHMKVPLLKEAYQRIRRRAATGVDGISWDEYGANLDEHLKDLEGRIQRGGYRPQPVRRVHIPKGDGKTRPLGIPSLEDKVVQQAARMILEPIYEPLFIGFSYGFRPRRSAHMALDAVAAAIARKVSWVLDADIRSFFDTIDHECLLRFVERRIADKRMVQLLRKWLRAGVMEDGKLHEATEGTPQGGIISPLLANIYLHYVLDLWVCDWRKRYARGEVYVVRYADDFVMGFQYEQDARAMRVALAARLSEHGLELHPEKTRVLEFGRFARQNRERRGLGKPETFEFLGFTHIAATNRAGGFQLKRRTSRKKRRAKLARIKEECERRRHASVPEQQRWLSSVLNGHYRYYGVPTNYRALAQMYRAVHQVWYRSLQRRSQRARWTWHEQQAFAVRFPLPRPRIQHPWPTDRFALRRP